MEKAKNNKISKNNKIFKALKIVKNIVCWVLLVCLVIVVLLFLTTRIKGEVPSMFGYSVFRVTSGSMEPELAVGDVILDRKVDDPYDIQLGDIVTYEGSGQLDGYLVTHEVIKAPYTDENGVIMLQTKGLANDEADEPISADRVTAVMVCKIPLLDAIYNFFLSAWGLVLFFLLVALLFFDELVTVVRILTGHDKPAENRENINEIIDRIQAEKQNEENENKEE